MATYLQGKEYPALSTCIYFYEFISTKLLERGEISNFSIYMILQTKTFFYRFTILKIHVLAALMDPCQKKWKILDNCVKKVPNNTITVDNLVLNKDAATPITKDPLILSEMKKYGIGESPSCKNNSEEPASKKEMSI